MSRKKKYDVVSKLDAILAEPTAVAQDLTTVRDELRAAGEDELVLQVEEVLHHPQGVQIPELQLLRDSLTGEDSWEQTQDVDG